MANYIPVSATTNLDKCIIVSAPHSLCPLGYTDAQNRKNRKCDLVAGKVGLALASRLSEVYSPVVFLASDQPREITDLNRKPSRSSQFRLKLDRCAKSGVLILDVHSFPDAYLIEAGKSNMFKENEIPPEIILLKGPGDNIKGQSLTTSLFKSLSVVKVNVKILEGIKVLDIINSAWDRNVPGILLEFNEKFNEENNRERLNFILSIIAKNIQKLF